MAAQNVKQKTQTIRLKYWIAPKTKLGCARIIIPQPGGKNKRIIRCAENAAHAQQIADKIRAEIRRPTAKPISPAEI